MGISSRRCADGYPNRRKRSVWRPPGGGKSCVWWHLLTELSHQNHVAKSLGPSKVFKLFLWMIVGMIVYKPWMIVNYHYEILWMIVNQFLQMESNWEWLAPCGFTTGIQSMYYIHLQNWGIIPIPWRKWRPRPHLNSMVKHGETLCLMVNACGFHRFGSVWCLALRNVENQNS